jgi:hypothetical protein
VKVEQDARRVGVSVISCGVNVVAIAEELTYAVRCAKRVFNFVCACAFVYVDFYTSDDDPLPYCEFI